MASVVYDDVGVLEARSSRALLSLLAHQRLGELYRWARQDESAVRFSECRVAAVRKEK